MWKTFEKEIENTLGDSKENLNKLKDIHVLS